MKNKSVLIIGYGKAGKRHAKIAKEEFGLDVWIHDQIVRSDKIIENGYNVSFKGDNFSQYDYAVICTSPDSHLIYLDELLSIKSIKILCEKPLCDLADGGDYYDWVDALIAEFGGNSCMVAYNWRYHSTISQFRQSSDLLLYSAQYRESIPEWGLLLDHTSHDVDILRTVTGRGDFEIEYVNHTKFDSYELLDIRLSFGCRIWEYVDKTNPSYKRRVFVGDMTRRFIKEYELNPEPEVYVKMWQSFLSGNYYPNLEDAIKTQKILEKINDRLKDN